MLRYYIVDDEQDAVDALHAMLQKKFGDKVERCGSNIKASLALEEIPRVKPDILFLDVEMPEMSGLELLKQLLPRNFQVIFTTAHEQYALPAIKAAAADYLLKPISVMDMAEALERCQTKLAAAKEAYKAAVSLHVNTGQQLLVLNSNDIIRIEGNNNYSDFYFTNRPKLTVSKTLKEFEEQLAGHGFYRVHQSHLINLQYVISVTVNGDMIQLKNNHSVQLSRRKKAAFLQQLKHG